MPMAVDCAKVLNLWDFFLFDGVVVVFVDGSVDEV